MPSAEDLASLTRLSRDPGTVGTVSLPPKLPKEFLDRNPSMASWEQEFRKWCQEQLSISIKGSP